MITKIAITLSLLALLTSNSSVAQPNPPPAPSQPPTNSNSGTNVSAKPASPPAAANSLPPAGAPAPPAQPPPIDFHTLAVHGEELRTQCIQNRRYVCGRILHILPDGLVVDSGYPDLLKPPLNHSWLVPGTAVVAKDNHLVESKEPDSICVGVVFLTDIPHSRRSRLKPKQYDYVVAHGYPCGERTYTSVGQIHHTVRRYSMGLETAVRLILQDEADQARANSSDHK